MTANRVELVSVCKHFADAQVLRELNLNVAPGEFVTLLGPSGCGKSTVLRLVAGLESPTSGQVITTADSPTTHNTSPKPAFVFQDPSLLPWRNALNNVALPLELTGIPGPQRRSQALSQLHRVGLSDNDAQKLPRMLSGGMKMRVSLARALVTEPELMLMDEPFGALDDILRMELNDQLLDLWNKFAWTTLFVTHQISEAVYLSDRVVVMSARPGEIKDIVPIDLPRPRRMEMRGSPTFAHLTLQLQQLLRESS